MQNISSKYLSITTIESLLKVNDEDTFINCNGILLIMPFGIVYGKFMSTDADNPKTLADIIMNAISSSKNQCIEDGLTIIGDGSQIMLKDATIKYPNGMNIKINEITIFCDQVCGYYPIDLAIFED